VVLRFSWYETIIDSAILMIVHSSFISLSIFVCRLLNYCCRFSLFYTECPTKAKRPAYPLGWVWFEPSLYLFMERL
jgi:hypothetical protein